MRRYVLIAAFVVVSLLTVPLVSGGEQDAPRPQSVLIETDLGNLSIRLDWENAPENCAAFVRYVRDGIYADSSFDGMDEFCLYGGKPSHPSPPMASNGNMRCELGPPGEFKLPHRTGAIGFRRTAGSCNPDKRSNSILFYIMLADHPQADGEFTVFGTVESEQPVVDAIKAKVLEHRPVPFKTGLRDK